MFWKDIPIVRVLIPFVGGIVIAINLGATGQGLYLATAAAGLTAICLYAAKALRRSRSWGRVFAGTMFVFFLLLGMVTLRQNTAFLRSSHFTHHLDAGTHVLVQVTEPPIEKARSYKIEATVKKLPNFSKLPFVASSKNDPAR